MPTAQADVGCEVHKVSLERLSWERFGSLAIDLAEKIGREYAANVVVGVGKSGVIPAAIIAKVLGVAEFYSVTVKFYDEGKPPERLLEEPEIVYHNVGDLRGKRVLVVDDFFRTGSTLDSVLKVMREKGADEVRVAVIALREDAKTRPDYYAMKFKDCVMFPWDLQQKPH